MRYTIEVSVRAERDLAAISPRYAAAVVAFILGPLADNPHRVGKPLSRELEGMHSARRGDYRVLYEIHDGAHLVLVSRVDHRSRVYRAR
ncbi:type II toxin-antitoxin system RelE/ParE family toxin [Tsukamurella sp. 1534]|uniref:type II toxin-antitoxin system RelE family toxin n=1 Tax=Tsukamurella sp. 1534 TaxID=1151061 RepID=UPI0003079FB8|nr:type II toxin-antitoxin system RelE/ParE family toxin [Tsukamurella sp. 1534]